jgi:hypothetical protein
MPRDNESLIDIERAIRRILRYTDQRAIAFTVQCRNDGIWKERSRLKL